MISIQVGNLVVAVHWPQMDRKPKYNGVRPSPQGGPSVDTAALLPQCHAAFGTIPSTLAWVDQSPVRQPCVVAAQSESALHSCYRLTRDPGQTRVSAQSAPQLGRGVGFLRVIVTPAVYPRLLEFLHFDIQSTGQKSHCVNTR